MFNGVAGFNMVTEERSRSSVTLWKTIFDLQPLSIYSKPIFTPSFPSTHVPLPTKTPMDRRFHSSSTPWPPFSTVPDLTLESLILLDSRIKSVVKAGGFGIEVRRPGLAELDQ